MMDMKRCVKYIFTTFVWTLALACNADAQEKPNIIWLMSEDIGPDLACYGMKAVRTPNLNKLAEDGIRYTNCFAANPICSPNRSAMMVGVYPNKINAGQHRSNHNVPLPEPYKPFTYWLRKAGYTTMLGSKNVMGKGGKIDCNFKNTALGSWDGKTNFGLFDKYDEFTVEDQPFFAQVQLKVTHRGDWWDRTAEAVVHDLR
jgi:N-sulfoglucosamine sulfohydrolase